MGLDTVTLPYPMVNVINGGLHADNNLFIQEFMIVPIGAQNVRSSLEIVAVVFQEIKNELKKRNLLTNVGDEGGFAPNLDSETEALDIIVEALDKAGQDSCVIALDVAATQYYDAQTGLYRWHDKLLSSYELIAFYENLAEDYPIYSLEDGLAQEDIMGWQELMNRLGERVQIVGDDLFATNYNRITQGIENGLATGVIIKPNQIGTVTEALQAIKLCKQYQLDAIVSHRSSETEDTFIVDLAVGANVGQLKAGGFCRGERIAKYNRLLTIEDHLIRLLMES
jgi:enolase